LRELRNIRLRSGLSQADLSTKTGVAEFTISEIEAGKRTPRPSTLRKLARGLDVQVADLYGEAEIAPKVSGPPLSRQRSFENHLAEEQRAHETRRALEDLMSYVSDRIDRWEANTSGEVFPPVNIDHGYSSDVWMDATALIGRLGTLRRRAEEELPPEVAATVRGEVVALIDRLQDVATRISALADEAAGITPETSQEEALRRMAERSEAIRRVKIAPEHTAQLAELRRRPEEGRKHAAEAKGEAVGE
jgi:transcriptional regulator with XRE-family HTH domain